MIRNLIGLSSLIIILISGCWESNQNARDEYFQVLSEYGREDEFFASINIAEGDSIEKVYIEIYYLWRYLLKKADTSLFISTLSGDYVLPLDSTLENHIHRIPNCPNIKQIFSDNEEGAVNDFFYKKRVLRKGKLNSNEEIGCLIDELFKRNYLIYFEDESGMLGIISVKDYKAFLESRPPE